MAKRLYVRNLLMELPTMTWNLFSQAGTVEETTVMTEERLGGPEIQLC